MCIYIHTTYNRRPHGSAPPANQWWEEGGKGKISPEHDIGAYQNGDPAPWKPGCVGLPGCDEDYPGRPAAIVIFGFSFVWPHVKLVLMHLFYYLPLEPGTRRNGNCALHPPMRPSNRRHTGPASTGAH